MLLDYNRAARESTNGQVEHLLGRSAEDLYPDMPEIIRDLNLSLATRTNIRRELHYRYRSTHGTRDRTATYVCVPPDSVIVHTEDETELRISRDHLRNLARRLQTVREEEQARIARAVEEDLGQTLTAAKLHLAWLASRISEEPLARRAQAVTKELDRAIESVRRISTELRPPVLDELGLEAAIRWQAGEFEDQTGCRCVLAIIAEGLDREPARDIAVFSVLQEALANVAHHARAQNVEIGLRRSDDTLVLEVRDDGRGIGDDPAVGSDALGLVAMDERARALGGRLDVARRAMGGTLLTLRIPLRRT